MAYLIRTLGWGDKEVLIFAIAHITLLAWATVLILNTKSISSVFLAINYLAIFVSGIYLSKQNYKLESNENELD
jgi:hypothetical protein